MESNQHRKLKSNRKLRNLSKEQLNGKWGLAALTILIYMIIYSVVDSIPVPNFKLPFFDGNTYWNGYFEIPIFTTIVDGAFALGLALYHLQIARNKDTNVSNLFYGFSHFVQATIAGFLIYLILVVGFVLFIIPGIIAMLGLSFTYYIMVDNPEMKAVEAMSKSWEMAEGHKMQLLFLTLHFIALAILSAFTLFIGLFWLFPYMYVSYSNFYLELKGEENEFGIEDHLIELT